MKNRTFICRIKSANGIWYSIFWNHSHAPWTASRFSLHNSHGQIDTGIDLFPLFKVVIPESLWTNKQIKYFSRLEYKHDYPSWRAEIYVKDYWRRVIENDDDVGSVIVMGAAVVVALLVCVLWM